MVTTPAAPVPALVALGAESRPRNLWGFVSFRFVVFSELSPATAAVSAGPQSALARPAAPGRPISPTQEPRLGAGVGATGVRPRRAGDPGGGEGALRLPISPRPLPPQLRTDVLPRGLPGLVSGALGGSQWGSVSTWRG